MLQSNGPSDRAPGYVSDLGRLLVVFGIFFFALLGSRPLSNPDEGRYTEIPREMLETGDYVTPRLNGVKYFEKPPLMYWLGAAALKVFGVNEFASRFWCAVLGLGGVLMTYAAGRALYDRMTGLFASVVLATTLLYYALTRLVILDLAVAVFIAGALFAFAVGMKQPAGTTRRWLFWAFYAAMGLAILTKSLIGFALPGAVLFFWILLLNRWKGLRPFYPFSGSAILLLVAVPWHVLAAQANHDFLQFFFVHEQFQRYTSKIHGRYEPWWFFIGILLAGLFPWVAFFFQAIGHSLAGGWRARVQNETAWFLIIWIVFIVGFFSSSQSKLIPYIMPVFPAAAVLIGHYLAAAWSNRGGGKITRGVVAYGVVCCALAIALFFIKLSKDAQMRAALQPWQWGVSGILILGAAATALGYAQRGTRFALIAIVASTAVLLVIFNPVGAIADSRSTKPLALTLREQIKSTDQVYAVGEYFQDFPVYLGRTVNVVSYEGELHFGIHSEPEKTSARFLKKETFLQRWREPGRSFAIAKRGDIADLLAQSDFPHVILGELRGIVLFSNQAQ